MCTRRDINNDPGSVNVILPCSTFRGGGLWLESPDGDCCSMDGSLQGRRHNLTMSGITFNPHQWHETCPWEGHRISIAVYTVKAVRTLAPADAENPTATAALRAQSSSCGDVGASLASLAKSVNDSVVEMASDWHNVLSMLPYISNMTGQGEGLGLPEKTLTDPLQEIKGAAQSLAACTPEAVCRQQSMLAWLQADLGTESQGPRVVDSAGHPERSAATNATNPKDSGKKKKSKARLVACPWPLEEACCPWPMATRDKTGGAQASARPSSANGSVLRHVSAPVQQPAPASPAVSSARTPVMPADSSVHRVAAVPSVQESPVASRSRGPLMPGLVTDFLVSREGELSNKTIQSEGSPQELNMSDSTPTMLSTQSTLSTFSKSTHSCDHDEKEFLESEELSV
eukprot:s7068_g4.t2